MPSELKSAKVLVLISVAQVWELPGGNLHSRISFSQSESVDLWHSTSFI